MAVQIGEMQFLLDVCAASRSMHSMLTEGGHDVLSASEGHLRATDEELLALAREAATNILITEDKDFGELVFVRRLPHPCIVRLVEMPVADKVMAVQELINRHPDAMREKSSYRGDEKPSTHTSWGQIRAR